VTLEKNDVKAGGVSQNKMDLGHQSFEYPRTPPTLTMNILNDMIISCE